MATTLERFEELLDEAALSNPAFLSTREKQDAMVGWSKVVARAQAELMRVLAVADDVAVETGARSTGHWLAQETRSQIGSALTLSRLADALDEGCPAVAAAMAEGAVNLAQAREIVDALEALPADLDPEVRAKGESYLVAEAAHFGPRELKGLGRKLLEVIAPDIADEADYQRLLAEDRIAQAACRLAKRDRGDGSSDISGRLPTPIVNRLWTYLESHTAPRRSLTSDVDRLPVARQRGEAFCALPENLPAKGLPQHGGTTTSVIVTVELDRLRDGLGLAEASTGDPLTADQVRRLACQADLLPAVLGRGAVRPVPRLECPRKWPTQTGTVVEPDGGVHDPRGRSPPPQSRRSCGRCWQQTCESPPGGRDFNAFRHESPMGQQMRGLPWIRCRFPSAAARFDSVALAGM